MLPNVRPNRSGFLRRLWQDSHAASSSQPGAIACESCHGSGKEHVDSGGDPEKIARLGELGPRESSKACVSCHKKQEGHFNVRQAIHRLGDVGCNDCHVVHESRSDRHQLARRTPADELLGVVQAPGSLAIWSRPSLPVSTSLSDPVR